MIRQHEWETAKAAPGLILVKRDEISEKIGSLWIPNQYREHTRKAYAVITSIHREVAREMNRRGFFIEVGDYVVLAPSAMKKIVFGFMYGKETELWAVRPEAIIARLERPANVVHADKLPGDADAWRASHGPEKDNKITEGDPRALR